MNYLDYRAALGIGFNDTEKQKIFTARMQVFFHDNQLFFDILSEQKFCYSIGVEMIHDNFSWVTETGFSRIWGYFENKKENFKDFLAALIVLANIHDSSVGAKDRILPYVKEALVDSYIPFDTIEDQDGEFIFPKGARELDDKLVTEPLQWLAEYPEARTAWIKALKAYADATDKNASDCADSFRKALEQFFREFFGGEKSLENYKSEYGKFMKDHGIPAELSNSFEKVLNQYTTYMNNYAKHGNGTLKIALEYIMYQTGSLIRFLITLKQEEK